ncbi:hypothetical protein ABTM34_20665, partial [Acinetobacter baumannii]
GFLFLTFTCNLWGQATLPVTRTAWSSAPTGWTDPSGSPNYATSFACSGNDGGKLANTGDFYSVNFTGTPSTVTFTTKSTATPTGC